MDYTPIDHEKLDQWVEQEKVEREETLDHLASKPLQEITGIVDAASVSASKSRDDEYWTISLNLSSWRVNNEALNHSKLYLFTHNVSDREQEYFYKIISAYKVIKITGKISDACPHWIKLQCHLEAIINLKHPDKELQEIASKLKKTFTLVDPFFGKLKLDRSANQLECKRRKGFFSKYTISIEREEETYNSSYNAQRAKEKVTAIEARQTEIKTAIYNQYYETYCTSWNSIGTITKEEFQRHLKLESITIYKDGSSSCWYKDGGLFMRHSLEINIDENDEFDNISLIG